MPIYEFECIGPHVCSYILNVEEQQWCKYLFDERSHVQGW